MERVFRQVLRTKARLLGLDEETGLYYYGGRYYNPRISLWLSVDPPAEYYSDNCFKFLCYEKNTVFLSKII
ncbi:MAG: RHS repeat-associated core domain-containing protein [Flavobacteriales bacterium]